MTGGASEGQAESDPSRRATDAKWTTNQEVAFADGFPALIVSEVCYRSCAVSSIHAQQYNECYQT